MDIEHFLNPETVSAIQAGGYVVMFGLMILEGPFVTLASAFLASLGLFDITLVAMLGWLGDTVGDIIFFTIGWYGLSLFRKTRKLDTAEKREFMRKLDILIDRHFLLALLIIKFTPYAPMIALPYLGFRHINPVKFIITTALLSLPVPIIATLIGFHMHTVESFLATIPQEYRIPGILLTGGIMIVLLGIVWNLLKKSKDFIEKKADSYTREKS